MRLALTAPVLVGLLAAQQGEPRPAAEILRDFDRVSMPSFSSGNDAENQRAFRDTIRAGSMKKAALALELFSADPDHPRVPDLMETRWATFNNVLHDHPAVIVETSLLLDGEDLREDLARVALGARVRALTLSPQADNRERLEAVRELIAVDARNERTGMALMDIVEGHLADPEVMRALFQVAATCWSSSAYVGGPAKQWLTLLDGIGRPFLADLPAEVRQEFAVADAERTPFTVVQYWSGWLATPGPRREIEALRALRGEFGDEVRIVGLLTGDLEARMPDARKAGVDWQQIGVPSGGLWRSLYGYVRTPCYFVLDAELEIVGIVGSAEAAALRIRQLRE